MKPIQSWNFEIPEVVEVKPISTLCILTYQERTLFSKLEKLKMGKPCLTIFRPASVMVILPYLTFDILTQPTLTLP